MSAAIEIRSVSKRFRLYKEKYTSLKERILHAGHVPYTDFWALRNIALDVERGETLGILGRNGCGKSTLLKCVAGILKPTEGEILLRGSLAAMLELGAGFQPDLSGRDNIYLNASLLGMSTKQIDRAFNDIVAFAELEEFIDNQVRFYSSGMYVRLGFAVAVNSDPDILLVDEVLAVGDERFQQKCMEKIHEFQRMRKTIVVVSHAADVMRQLCNRVAVINAGELVTVGPPGESIRAFRDVLLETGEPIPAGAEGEPEPTSDLDLRAEAPAVRPVRVLGSRLETPSNRPHLRPGEGATVVVDLELSEPLDKAALSCSVWASNGAMIFDSSSDEVVHLPAGQVTVRLRFDDIPLLDGAFAVNIRLQEPGGGRVHAQIEPAATIVIENPGTTTGILSLPVHVEILSERLPGEPLLAQQLTT